ncbi:MAG: UDP-N-acetylmuramoyl-L-alanyl-D-glutamate--2,6-diaminopimelate ligase [Rhodobiaceae bacterium]|nr:UDP-N-acetylmuramoyl-L-alanyl-D-glutamate--2,6-diaminopimelate ligase [Rhodobiaceae bacterium]|tara:strand:- start:72823 stop:74268 length:1446 start_codon:yes stop_codon:yes gene_type:complete
MKNQLVKNKRINLYGLSHEVIGISIDSREVNRGDLFFSLEQRKIKALSHINQAIDKGALGIISSKNFDNNSIDTKIPIIKVDSVRKELSIISSEFYPNQPRIVAAITGTNGKTSVAKFTEQIWKNNGIASASIGTLGNSRFFSDSSLTTPDPVSLHKQLNDLSMSDYENVIIEASSHGLDQHRIDNVRLSGAAFTSFSRDHLDYHKNMKQYLNAKKRLFTSLIKKDSTAVVNLIGINRRYHGFINDICSRNLITIGTSNATINLLGFSRSSNKKINLKISVNGQLVVIETPFIALFQAINATIAGCVASMDSRISLMDYLMSIKLLKDISGRLEFVASKYTDANIYVDYAHTPSAMKAVLESLRPITKNNLILVFGAGGNRDKGKRNFMRDIAKNYADFIIVTDDNPRFEDPKKIRSQLMVNTNNFIEIADRHDAIKYAIDKLESGDNLIICGKGHEEYMIYQDSKISFSDQLVVKSILDL